MPFEVWSSGWTSLHSPPPPQPCPIPATGRTHLKGFAFKADTRPRLARWKHCASGLPYQWRQWCVTHRERTSCTTTLLLFLLQTAAIALSFFFSPCSSSFLFCHCEKEVWGWPVVHTFRQFFALWMHLGLFSISTFVVCFSLSFHWLLRSTLVWSLVWILSPESCAFEVSDESFSSFAAHLFWKFLSVKTNGSKEISVNF